MDYKKNEKYFQPVKLKLPIILIILGLLFMVVPPLGILILLCGIVLLYFQIAGKPTDEYLASQAHSALANLKNEALNKLGLDESEVSLVEPIIFEGYDYKKISTPWLWKLGKDEYYRSSNYAGTIFLFSEHQVYFYQHRFSLINNEKKIYTDEYFYGDIVSVATTTETETCKNPKGVAEIIDYEAFVLTTTGATKVYASIQADDPNVERSVKGMKQLLRQKKLGK